MMTEVITPPAMGAAIRFITSEPVPALHMMGSRPAMMTDAVMTFGRTRCTAPWSMALFRSPQRFHESLCLRICKGMVEVEQHYHAGLGIQAGQRDHAHPHCQTHVVTEQINTPDRAYERKRDGSRTIVVLTSDRVLR